MAARKARRAGSRDEAAATASGRVPRGWVFLGLVFLAKLVVLWRITDHPLVQANAGLDTTAYVNLARQVLAGDLGLGPGLYYVSPLYIYFLAACLTVADSFAWVRLVQVVLGTGAVAFAFLAAREWFGQRAAWLAGGFTALTGLFTFYEVLILQAALDPFLTAAALYALARGLARGETRSVGIAGGIMGLASLNRPNMLLAGLGLAALLLASGLARSTRPVGRARLGLALGVGLLVGLAPAVVRNVAVSGQWTFASSHGGLNFYMGNNADATGFYRAPAGVTASIDGQARDVRLVAERALGRSVTDAEASNYFLDQAVSWIREHPAAAVWLFLRKVGHVFNAQHIALPYSYPFYAYDAGTWLGALFVGPWLLLPLGVVGLWMGAPATRRAEYFLWASFVPLYALAVAVFIVAERYRLPMLVPLAIGAGAAVDTALRRVSQKNARGLRAPVLLLIPLAAAMNWRHGLHDGRWDEGLRMVQHHVAAGDLDTAREWADRLEAREPRPGFAMAGLGMQLLLTGRAALAVEPLSRALAADPNAANTEYALGQALLQAGDAARAVDHLQRGFDRGTTLPMAGMDLVSALQKSGRPDRAAALVGQIRVPDSADAESWLRVGRLAMELKAAEAAEPYFKKGVALAPGQAGAHQQLGLNLLVQRRYRDAAASLEEAARLDPRNADTLAHLALAEAQLGDVAHAQEHVTAALAADPSHPVARQVAAALAGRGSGPGVPR